ncbi:hypothetical protein CBR_g78862 [Chara braunii]|uniref:Uncharacterized protein n=1 Tax=Chara braunii TaxID=69332 RepID=A0A388KAN0_CHABU|nr:hypothetical protein CBR_g78862 [Chara braunii]|eukprot:GBG67081.1 hypothetical protein CBR_g78862 [Chara braunii]
MARRGGYAEVEEDVDEEDDEDSEDAGRRSRDGGAEEMDGGKRGSAVGGRRVGGGGDMDGEEGEDTRKGRRRGGMEDGEVGGGGGDKEEEEGQEEEDEHEEEEEEMKMRREVETWWMRKKRRSKVKAAHCSIASCEVCTAVYKAGQTAFKSPATHILAYVVCASPGSEDQAASAEYHSSKSGTSTECEVSKVCHVGAVPYSTTQTQDCDTSAPIHVDASLLLDNTSSRPRAAPAPSSIGLTTIRTPLDMPCGMRDRVESVATDINDNCTPCASDLPLGDVPADGSHDCDIGTTGDTSDDDHAEMASLRRFMTFRDAKFVGQRSQWPPELSDSGPSTVIPAHDRRGIHRQPAYESSDREAFSSGDDLASPDAAMRTTPPTQQALMGDVKPLEVGGRYASIDALCDAVVFCAVAFGFEFHLKRSNKTRYYVACAQPDCTWTLEGKAAHAGGPAEIVRLTPHRPGCRKPVQPDMKRNKHVKLRWVELMVEKKLREDNGTTSTKLKKWFDKAVKTHVSYSKCLRARTSVLQALNRPPEEGFNDLRRYCRVLHETNPGSIIDLELDGLEVYATEAHGHEGLYDVDNAHGDELETDKGVGKDDGEEGDDEDESEGMEEDDGEEFDKDDNNVEEGEDDENEEGEKEQNNGSNEEGDGEGEDNDNKDGVGEKDDEVEVVDLRGADDDDKGSEDEDPKTTEQEARKANPVNQARPQRK